MRRQADWVSAVAAAAAAMSRRDRKTRSKRGKPDAPQASIVSRVVPVVLIAALSLIAMGRLCVHEFTNWDDNRTVAENPIFNPPAAGHILQHWRQPFMELYVPVTYMVWGALAFATYDDQTGLNPHVFHTFNVLLHTANSVLVLLLLRRLLNARAAGSLQRPGKAPPLESAAFAGAALFVVHPVQVETVGWISGMKDLLCGFLVLLALLGYVAFAQNASDRPRRGWRYYTLATLAFVLAMLAKPTAVMTPVMAVTIDRLALGRRWPLVLLAALPWLLLAIPCVIWTKMVQPATHVIDAPPLWLRPLVASDALAFYLGKLVWPASLAIDYGRPPAVAIHQGWVYFTWIAPVAVAVILCVARRRMPLALTGGLLAAVGVLPVLGLVRFDFQKYSTVTDHYLYLPLVGVSLALAAVLARLPVRRWAVPAGALLLILCIRSIAQAAHWRDSETLMGHTIAVNPDSWSGHKNLAAALLRRGAMDDALQAAERAVALRPADAEAIGTVAAILGAKRMLPEAELKFRKALELEPNSSRLLAQLAGVVADQGRIDEALGIVNRSLAIDPQDEMARMNLGIMLLNGRHDRAGAAREFAVWAELSPRDSQAHTYLGLVLADLGRYDEARHHLRMALRLNPSSLQARGALARLGSAP
jgi:protein O-mannosyl-transferase